MSKIKKVIDLLKMAGIDSSSYIGKVDPNKVKLFISKTQKTATKSKLISALNKDQGTYADALKIFENDAKYISQMNEMELTNFANNIQDYFTVGGKVKWKPSNVVTTEGTPVVGKKLETLSTRKGGAGEADTTSLEGSMKGLMTLVDELKGISPKMRNKMDRDELVAFIKKMRGKDFTNQEIKAIREYMDEWGIGLAKEKAAPAMAHAKKLGAKDKEEFQFIEEYLDNVQTTSPEKFREMFDVKKINMDISDSIDKKLEKHFKKKFKWDDTKKDGGLDDATFTKYEDELYEAQKEFGNFHTVYDTHGPRNIWGHRKGTSWVNNPKNYLDEASVKLQSITGEGLNTNFWKNYTDEVLTKYPKPEKFEYGGLAGMLGERVPYRYGKTARSKKRKPGVRPIYWNMPPQMIFREPVNFPYKSLEDIPEDVLAMLRKDPNFDLDTFLTQVGWSDPDKTRIQTKLKGDDEAWGVYSPMFDMSFLNYQKFGESEPIGDGLLSIKSPTDADKVQTILHEMRHQKMAEPWFMKSSAIPKWVREYEEKGLPHYLDKDVKDKYSKYRGDQQDVSGEELYVRFMDQHFGDVAESGSIAGSDYKPYFDKILKDHWDPYAERYKEILNEEKRVKSKPYGLAGGGIAGMLGEPTYQDEDHRVPYDSGKFVEKKDLPSGLKAEVGDPTPGWGLSDLVSRYFLYKEVLPGVSETTKKYLTDRLLKDLNDQGYSPKDFKAYIDEQFPESKAGGGRIGFKLGGIDKARRAFLQAMGAGAAGVGAAKAGLFGLFKAGKPVAKDLIQVPIKNIEGMPAWFKPLVNKVIKEGDEISSGAERVITHQTKLPNSKTDIYVNQDLSTGDVWVDIGASKHGFADGKFGQPVRLQYKASEMLEGPFKKGQIKKTKEEFNVEEAEFTGGRSENVKFEETSVNKFGKHESNFDEVEAFAKGKVKKTRNISNQLPPDDFASGGRVPMVFGGKAIGVLKNLLSRMKKKQGIPRGEKTLQPDKFAKSIMSEEDKLKLLQLETKYADSVLEQLKLDRQLFKQLETNKEMKDQGLDFLMKHFVDTQAPHMKKYKNLADIDQAILELETLVKNKMLKEGRQLNASGGIARLGYTGGKIVKGAAWVIKNLKKQLSQFEKEDFMGKLSNISSMEKNAFKNEINTLIKQLEKGGAIPQQMLETMRKDKRFKDVIKTKKIKEQIKDSELRELEEVLLDYGKNVKQKEILKQFDVTGLKKHAFGGRVSLSSGGVAGMLGE